MLNGQLFFTAQERTHGAAIWTTDGTLGGTTLATELPHPTQSSNPQFLGCAANGTIFFATDDPDTAFLNLWSTDGSAVGTTLLYYGRTNFADVRVSTIVGNNLYFDGTDAAHGTELWLSNGTVGGTSLFKDIYVGTSSSTPVQLASAGGCFTSQ